MSVSDKKLVIGRIGKAHGLKGWMRLHSETAPIENILNYQPWSVEIQGQLKDLKITGSMRQDDVMLVHFEGYDSPEAAKTLAGSLVSVERDLLPELPTDQYYWTDLEGLSVYNMNDEWLGIVDSMMEAGACDVMVIKGDAEQLIPFDKQNVVKNVDLQQGKIIVAWNED